MTSTNNPGSRHKGSYGSTLEKRAEIIAALLKGKRTRLELSEMTGSKLRCIDAWLSALRDSGVVRIAGYRDMGEEFRGKRPREWEMQRQPFAMDDAK